MEQDTPHSQLVPIPLVREAAGFVPWSRIYYDADRGRLGTVRRLGTRKYVAYDAARAYIAKHWPDADPGALDKLIQPEIVVAGSE